MADSTGEMITEEALRQMSDEDLKALSERCHKISSRTHTLQSCLSALHGGIAIDLELSRRIGERVIALCNELSDEQEDR